MMSIPQIAIDTRRINVAANDSAPVKPSAPVTVWEIKAKDSKRFGRVIPGDVAKGHHAQIVPGKSIRLFGEVGQRYDGTRGLVDGGVFKRDFKIGDEAVVGSYNLVYTGIITAITEKTITVVEYAGTSSAKTHRMDLFTFDMRNRDFNAEETARRNENTLAHI